MRKLSDLEDVEKDRNMIVVCCGSSITEYYFQIKKFIADHNAVVIGMNKMTNFITPKYHLWTNKKRWKNYSNICKEESIKLIGESLDFDKISRDTLGECIRIDYDDKRGLPIKYENHRISGFFRSTGNLSIMLCNIMGAKNIYIAGLDGLTLYPKKDYESLKVKHHCNDYGDGNTAEGSWERCKEVDESISYSLSLLKDYGIKFEIITPTKFKEYYNSDILGV